MFILPFSSENQIIPLHLMSSDFKWQWNGKVLTKVQDLHTSSSSLLLFFLLTHSSHTGVLAFFSPFLWDWLALFYFRAFMLSVPSSWSILILKLHMIHFSLPFSSLLKLICQKKPYLTPSKIMEPLSLSHSLSAQLGSCFFFINFSKYIDFVANYLLIVWCISTYKVHEERNLALS